MKKEKFAAVKGVENGSGQDVETQYTSTECLVSAPRKTIWVFFLMVFTFSLYIPFWAVGRARDIKVASGKSYTPWLWFFTPLFWIAGVIAFGQMFKDLQVMESPEQRKKWDLWAVPWFIAFVLLSLFFNFQGQLKTPFFYEFIALIPFCALFAVLHHRFNRWKTSDKRLKFKGKVIGYVWYEWIIMVILVPLYLFTFYLYAWPTLKTMHIASYKGGQSIADDSLGFSFIVHGGSWKKVKSDEADFRMIGPGDITSIFVYKYGGAQTIDDVSAVRFSAFNDAYQDLKCTEAKSFEDGRRGIRSSMFCSARDWAEYAELASVVAQMDGKLIEFVGITSNTNQSYSAELGKKIQAMANSFKIQQVSDDE